MAAIYRAAGRSPTHKASAAWAVTLPSKSGWASAVLSANSFLFETHQLSSWSVVDRVWERSQLREASQIPERPF